ncbi:MAG: GWxTD domain-containing protein [Bacteroidetes bacterium]|nr:GWxTD domain-containing protein [Bacteroidota bacterium]MBU1678878.1 GWxTD domain-containing protein [Bacteroidota bacterium]MBU2507270.1 GWxTD domain-containing protein [Bacteroidota bacterium]
MKKYLLLSVFLCSAVFAQVEHSKGKSAYGFFPGFYIETANFKSDTEGKTRLDVFLKMPYSNIQFIRSGGGFSAKYSVSIAIQDEKKEIIILERRWNEQVSSKDFTEASSKNNFNYSYRTFDLDAGNYNLRCEVIDKDSKKNYVVDLPVRVVQYKKPLQFSDLILASNKVKGDNTKIIPSVSNRTISGKSNINFYYEIYSDAPTDISVEYKVLGSGDRNVHTRIVDLSLKSGRNEIHAELENVGLVLGGYTLIVNMRDKDWKVADNISKKFVSQIFGFPESITDLDKAIEQMTYIASGSQIDSISEVKSFDERLEKYKEFWKRKDPSPNTEENEVLAEYYRRVDYANVNFKHYFDGWRTDMGMIYIILGPPSNVERHPFEYNSKPYEVWDYYDINKRFVFIDQTGFGDYRLLDQQYGDWYRYRQ